MPVFLLRNKKFLINLLTYLFIISQIYCERTPVEPKGSREITFQGKAFLAGQPAPVNPWHLPLNFDIEIISFLPDDSTSYDTTYTDSTGTYTSTRMRIDGRYTIISRYPFYSNDTVYVYVKDGQVVNEIPRLFSQRLLKTTIFPDSLEYHSLNSFMHFIEYVTNLSPTDTLAAPQWLYQILVKKDDPSVLLMTVDINLTYGFKLIPLQTALYVNNRLLKHFTNDLGTLRPKSGEYYLYAVGQVWTWWAPYSYNHYRKDKRRWWFKIMDPTEITIKPK